MKEPALEPIVVTPKAACRALDYGMTRLYELLGSGELEAFKDGRATRITTASIRAYVARRLADSPWAPSGDELSD